MACARWMVCHASILRRAELVFLCRVPADGGGIKEHFGALQRGEPRALGIPLVPADERADAAGGGIDGLETEIAGREVILLVIKRIVGDVHLAIDAGDVAVGVERNRGVVVKARARGARRAKRRWRRRASRATSASLAVDGPGIGSARSKSAQIFALAEILRAEELRQADDLARRAARLRGCGCSAAEKVRLGIGAHAHLHQGDRKFVRRRHALVLMEPPLRMIVADATRPTPARGIGLCCSSESSTRSLFTAPRILSKGLPHAVPTLPGSAPRRRWWWSTCRACRPRPTG